MAIQNPFPISPKPLVAVLLAAGALCFSFTSKSFNKMNPPVKTLIYHKVANFDTWKATFEAAKDFRAAAGELSYEIGTLRNDPSIAYVLNEWPSIADFEAFVQKPELQEAMKQAGVLEPPHFVVFVENEHSNPNGNGKVRTMISHPVEDFNTWKATFAAAKEFRAAAGELSYEIGTLQLEPKTVYVLNEWDSTDSFQAFLANPDLADAMKRAGVLAPPTVFIFDKKGCGK